MVILTNMNKYAINHSSYMVLLFIIFCTTCFGLFWLSSGIPNYKNQQWKDYRKHKSLRLEQYRLYFFTVEFGFVGILVVFFCNYLFFEQRVVRTKYGYKRCKYQWSCKVMSLVSEVNIITMQFLGWELSSNSYIKLNYS